MIYVEEKNFDKQIDLLSLFVTLQKSELVVWFYPESKLNDFMGIPIYSADFIKAEPVTRYQEEGVARCTSRIHANGEMIQKLRNEKEIIIKNCDSLCIYFLGSHNWDVCTIGHEGMGLVRNEQYLSVLNENKFNASLEAPSWW